MHYYYTMMVKLQKVCLLRLQRKYQNRHNVKGA